MRRANVKQTKVQRVNAKRRNTKTSLIGFVLIFLVGAGILLYPTISFWFADYTHIISYQSYERSVVNLTTEEKEVLWDEALYYNERLVNSVVEDPFANLDNIDPFGEYYQTLDTGDGVMGYIRIPTIHVLLPMYHGVSEEVLDKGVGHIQATALPIGGKGTHAVLTGHTGLGHAKMFNDLAELKNGDTFYLEILEETFAYEITSIEVVLPDDVSSLHREEGQDKVTLVTCTPYGVNSHRLLVTGERVPYTEESVQNQREDKAAFPWWIVFVVLGMITLVLVIGNKIKRRAEKVKNAYGTTKNKHVKAKNNSYEEVKSREHTKAKNKKHTKVRSRKCAKNKRYTETKTMTEIAKEELMKVTRER